MKYSIGQWVLADVIKSSKEDKYLIPWGDNGSGRPVIFTLLVQIVGISTQKLHGNDYLLSLDSIFQQQLLPSHILSRLWYETPVCENYYGGKLMLPCQKAWVSDDRYLKKMSLPCPCDLNNILV